MARKTFFNIFTADLGLRKNVFRIDMRPTFLSWRINVVVIALVVRHKNSNLVQFAFERSANTDKNNNAHAGLFQNTNAKSVLEKEKEKRDKQKQENEEKKVKNKEDREKQKAKVEQRKEKEKKRTQKGERRR